MIYQRQNGSCVGRGFYWSNITPPYGFLANLKTWITQSYPSGPGWSIIDDQSMDTGYEKWGKISTYVGASMDNIDKIKAITDGSFRITIGTTTANVTNLDFSSCNTYDDAATVIQNGIQAASGDSGFTGAVCGHFMARFEYNNEAYLLHNFAIIAGVRGINVGYLTTATSNVGTDISGYGYDYLRMSSENSPTIESGIDYPFIVACSASSPNWDDDPPNKYLKIGQDGGSGYVYINTYLNWDSTTHTGLHLWSHSHINTLDAAQFTYDFRGGNEIMIIQTFSNSSWSSFIIDKWVGDPVLVESSSIKGVITSDVDTTNNTVTLQTGQGSLFTEGNSYFLIDLNKSECIQYLQIDAGGITGDNITFNRNLNMPANTGAILSPYFHRVYMASNGNQNYHLGRIPYISAAQKEVGFGDRYTDRNGCYADYLTGYISSMSPSDSSSYACMKPGIVEETNDYQNPPANRAYGSCKNIYVTALAGMGPATDGRTINSKNFLYFKNHSNLFTGGSSSSAILVPDYDENT